MEPQELSLFEKPNAFLIKRVRMDEGLTAKEAAELALVNGGPTAWYRYEGGRTQMHESNWMVFLYHLGLVDPQDAMSAITESCQ